MNTELYDIVIIGGGIMGATLATLINTLEPSWSVLIAERAKGLGTESSDPWNNAGTGHCGNCELNYSPLTADGSIPNTRAVDIAERFYTSLQFWSTLVENKNITDPSSFINKTPHMNFVSGADNIAYLKKRQESLRKSPFFAAMQYSEDAHEMEKRLPLMARGRDKADPIALSWIDDGTDIDFGTLTKKLIAHAQKKGTEVQLSQEVTKLSKEDDQWNVTTKNLVTDTPSQVKAKYVFVGAGGETLRLLQAAKIPEIRGFGGFPIGGAFIRCTNPDLISLHSAKVYGRESKGAPPMSLPHLDTRVIDGKAGLLFGPYASFSTRFLVKGSLLDLPTSIKLHNLPSLLGVGLTEMPLTKYLITELLQNMNKKIEKLQDFVPTAHQDDWELYSAGQRVQIIMRDRKKGGKLEFGTKVIHSPKNNISGLLGASPGASTSVSAMLGVLTNAFPDQVSQWSTKISELIPSYGQSLHSNPSMLTEIHTKVGKNLQLW